MYLLALQDVVPVCLFACLVWLVVVVLFVCVFVCCYVLDFDGTVHI